MHDPRYVPELPEHPELRQLAEAIERAGMMGEILDASFRCVFFSTESARGMGLSADEAHSVIGNRRQGRRDPRLQGAGGAA